MASHSLFDITPEHIAALDDEGLRLLIGRLCEADLRRRGHPTSAVLYGGNQIAADGGIDVRVELSPDSRISGFIPRPVTCFQAKADDMPASKIATEMRPSASQADGSYAPCLRPSIRELALVGGAYVIVSSKGSTTDSRLAERRDAMRAAVADLLGNEALHLDFYDRRRMATWVSDYPGEVLWLRDRIGQPLRGWQPFGNWSRAPAGADEKYLSDDTARLRDLSTPQNDSLPIGEGIARLRSLLAVPGGIVRLTGLSGTGKTRLVEALFDSGIGEGALDPSWAVYADIGAEMPQPSVGQLADQLRAEGKRTVLVLDNCPRETHDAIAPVCKSTNGSLSLITVDLDIRDERPEGTDVFRLQNASEGVIEALVDRRFAALPQAVRQRIAHFSDGNARVALLIAEAASRESFDANLANLGDDELFRRLFYQKKGESDELLRAAEVLALVYSFDGETTQSDSAELPLLARIGGLEMAALFRATGELGRREIIQSRGRWRAILPQPLANWLAQRALADLPALEVANAFWDHQRLLRSFAHRLSYLHESPEAQRIAAAWLKPGGPLSDLRTLTQFWNDPRIDVVAYLAPLAPATVLEVIERFASVCTPESLTSKELPSREKLITLLRKLAWFPEHFRRAVLALARFIPTDRTGDNRARDAEYLQELFWPLLSGSNAGPEVRIAVLEELLSAPENPTRQAGLVALRGMLRAARFSSAHDFSLGGRPVDYGWRPKTPGDYEAWFGGALSIARRLALSNSAQRTEIRSIFAESFRNLCSIGSVFDLLEQTVFEIGSAGHWPEGWLAVRKTLALGAERMDPSQVARLVALSERLAPQTIEDRLHSKVLTPASEHSRLAMWDSKDPRSAGDLERQDPSSPHDRYQSAHQAVVEQARELGRRCAHEPMLFDHFWTTLFGPLGYQSYSFGQGLAQGAADIAATWAELTGHFSHSDPDDRNPSLLCGFLKGAAAANGPMVEGFLDNAIHDPDLGRVFPYLQIEVGLDPPAIRRLLEALGLGLAPSGIYVHLAYGRATEGISPTDLSQLLVALTRLPGGHAVAAEILSMHFHDPQGNRTPWDRALLLCGREILLGFPLEQVKDQFDHSLGTIARICLAEPEATSIAQTLCEHIRDAAKDRTTHFSALDELISTLVELHPLVALNCWVGNDSKDWTSITDRFVLNSDRNPLRNVATSILLEWVNQEPETRYSRLAAVIPQFDKAESDGSVTVWSEPAVALLATAPDRETVFRALVTERIRPNEWVSSVADVLEQRRSLIRQFFDDPDPAIRRAAQELDENLEKEIAWERSHESERDERFE